MFLEKLLFPYGSILIGAAWNLQQSLDGLGFNSPDLVEIDIGGVMAGGYWSANEVFLRILGGVCIFGMVLSVLLVACGYVLGRKRGAIASVLILLLPGVLNSLSLWPHIPYIPRVYVFGAPGVLGSPLGIFYLLLLTVMMGWAIGILLMDGLRIGEAFWSGVDHLWYAVGLVAIVFFVADAQSGGHVRDMNSVSRDAQQLSAFLRQQVGEYDRRCRDGRVVNQLSCEWASDVLQRLLDYQTAKAEQFVLFGPKSSADMYGRFVTSSSPSEIEKIREEIATYNAAVCPVRQINERLKQLTRPSALCQTTPGTFCQAFPDPYKEVEQKEFASETTALASECAIPTLVRLRRILEDHQKHVESDERNKHYRWFYYLVFAAFAGFKVSSSTMKLAGLHQRDSNDRRRAIHLLSSSWSATWWMARIVLLPIWRLIVCSSRCAKKLTSNARKR